jgi:DDE superfamily endonuclease
MRIPAAGADQKHAIFGALDYASGHLLHTLSAHKDETTFIAFLERLLEALRPDESVVVVLDNAGYHKSLAVREWWRAHAAQLQPFFLPAYTPQLNLIERLWRYLKAKLACHRWWNDLARLQQAAETLLTGLEVHFHTTDGPAFRSPHNFCETA